MVELTDSADGVELTEAALGQQEKTPTEMVVDLPPPPSAFFPPKNGQTVPMGCGGGDDGSENTPMLYSDAGQLEDSEKGGSKFSANEDIFLSDEENS